MGRVGYLSFISLDVYCHGRSRGVWRCFIFWYTLDYTAALRVRAQDCVAHVLVYTWLCAYTWRYFRLFSKPVYELPMLQKPNPIRAVTLEGLPSTCPLAVYTC